MRIKYSGSIYGLQKLVRRCCVFGDWHWYKLGRFYQFRSTTGEIMNHWPSTGTITFQGRPGPLQPRFTAVFVDSSGIER